jgi:hypothetical protein
MRKKIKKAIPVRCYDGLSQLRPNAGGIDIGGSEVWVDVGNKDAEPTRMFETFTADLNRMGDWLKSCGIQTVAMESTGRLSRKLCLRSASSACLEAGLKHRIELREHLVDTLIGRSPFSIFKG